jgi:hypothetical protein
MWVIFPILPYNYIMKTPAQQKFDEIVKEGFWNNLKPLRYKKKGNTFYFREGEIGRIINIQKSMSSTAAVSRYTINVGFFSPEYWKGMYNYTDSPVPVFPSEPVCIIRQRIGNLIAAGDQWYDIAEDTDAIEMTKLHRHHVKDIILPFFDTINSNEELLSALKSLKYPAMRYAGLIVLAELKRIDEAKAELDSLIAKDLPRGLIRFIKELGVHYGLISSSQ